MTAIDLRSLCIALGFTSVITANVPAENQASRAVALGRLIEAFCLDQNPDIMPGLAASVIDEADATAIDVALDRHIRELRDSETTYLPEDRAILLKYYDRLQQRKSRRAQSAFYAKAEESVIADLVLRYLDEEITDSIAETSSAQ